MGFHWGFRTPGANGGLKRIDLAGGAPRVVAAQPGVGGGWQIRGTWGQQGDILFWFWCPNWGPTLCRVAASGGPTTTVTRLEKDETFHSFPQFLPDGERFLFYATRKDTTHTVELARLSSFERKTVLEGTSPAAYAPDPAGQAYLLYTKGNQTLMAQRFNVSVRRGNWRSGGHRRQRRGNGHWLAGSIGLFDWYARLCQRSPRRSGHSGAHHCAAELDCCVEEVAASGPALRRLEYTVQG